MKVTAFCGSPREDGNTQILLKAILRGARGKGADTVFRNLNTMNIKPCQACAWCKENPGEFCVMKDDMQTIYGDIGSSEALVIGSPVYMWQMTAQTKIMVDRLYGTLLPGFASKTGPRKLVLAFTHGAPEDSFREYIQSTAKMLAMLKFQVVDTIVAGNAGARGSLESDAPLMKRAEMMGASLVG